MCEIQGTGLSANVETIIGPGQAGYSSNMAYTSTASGFDGEYQYAPSGTGSVQSTWTFTGLVPGQYQVSSTWLGNVSGATNAPYTIYDGSTSLGTVNVSQLQTPTGVNSRGTTWQQLAVVTISSGTLKVILTNNANGYVEADAVRIVGPLPPVQVTGSSNVTIIEGSESPSTANNTDFGQALVGGAPVTQTYTITNTGTSTLNLVGSAPVSVSNTTDFTVTQPTVSSLAAGASTTFQVTFSPTAANLRQAALSILTNNAAADPFTFEIQGTGLSANVETIIGPGQAGYSSNMAYTSTASGFDGEYQYAGGGTGTVQSTWTFTGLVPGQYQVSTTWLGNSGGATNAPYTLYDGSTSLGILNVSQVQTPVGVNSRGTTWQQLAVVTISSGTLKVILTNNANGYVEADAVRIVGPLPPVQVTGSSNVSIIESSENPSTANNTDFGQALVGGAPVTQTYTITNTGTSTLNLVGSAPVSVSNTTDFTVTQPTVSSLAAGASTTFQVAFAPTAANLRQAVISILTNNVAANPFTFEIQGTGLSANVETIVGPGQAGYSSSGMTTSTATGFDGEYQSAPSGSGSDQATWTFIGLVPGQYQISSTWPGLSNGATNAPYSIYDNTTSLGTVNANQVQVPTGVTSRGATWQQLAVVTIGSGTLKVILTNNANGYVAADAVRIVGPLPPVQVTGASNVSIIEGSQNPSTANNTDFGQALMGGAAVTQTFTITNTGTSTLNLVGSAPVSVSNTTDFTVTQPAVSSLAAGASTTFQVSFAPTANNLRQALLSILTNSSAADPFTFEIQGTGLPANVEQFIVPGDGGYTSTGMTTTSGSGFGGEYQSAPSGSGSDQAAWTFTGLAPGQYQVSSTWITSSTNATNTPYTLYDGSTSRGTFNLNQKVAPSGASSQGAIWQQIAIVNVTSGTLKVVMTNSANGYINADAVRIVGALAPVLAPITTPNVYVNDYLSFLPTVTEPGATLTYSLGSGAPSGATINSSTGLFTWITSGVTPGTYPVTIHVADGFSPSLSTNETLNIAVLARQPQSVAIGGASTYSQGAAYSLSLSAPETDGDTISSWQVNWDDGTALNPDIQTVTGNPSSVNHVYTQPPSQGASSYSITATATDQDGAYPAGSPVTVTPLVSISGATTVNSGSAYVLNLSSDISTGTITSWTINWGDGSTPQTIQGDPASATYLYAPFSSGGTNSYTISATATTTAPAATYPSNTQAVSVLPPASFTVGPDQILADSAGAQSIADWATGIAPISGGATNLSFNVTSDSPGLFAAVPAVSPSGTLTFTPLATASGTATVTVVLQDQNSSGQTESSAAQTFTISVLGLTTAGIANVSVAEGDANPVLQLWPAFSDPNQPASALSYSIVGNSNPGLFSSSNLTANINTATGALTLPLASGVTGSAQVTIQAEDAAGATVQTTFTVTVGTSDTSSTPPTIINLTLLNGTGDATTGITTTDPTLSGTISGPSDVAYQEVQFKYNSDTQIDGTALGDANGNFTFTPTGLPTGSNTVYVRAEISGASGAPDYGPWAPITFTLDAAAPAPLPDVSSLTLANNTSGSSSVLSTSDPTVSGQLSAAATTAITIQFDTTGDGNPDGSITLAPGATTFAYTPSNLAQGQVTIRARTALTAAQDGGSSSDSTIVETGNWYSISFEYSSTPNSSAAQAAGTADAQRAALLGTIGQVSTTQQNAGTNSLSAANDSAAASYHQAVDGAQATDTSTTSTATTNYNSAIASATATYNSAVSAAQGAFTTAAPGAGDDPTVGVPADFAWQDTPSLDPTVNGEPAPPQPGTVGPSNLPAPTFTGPAVVLIDDPNYTSSVNTATNIYNGAVTAANTTYNNTIGNAQTPGTVQYVYSQAIGMASSQFSNAQSAAQAAYNMAVGQSPPSSLDTNAAYSALNAAISSDYQTEQAAATAATATENAAGVTASNNRNAADSAAGAAWTAGTITYNTWQIDLLADLQAESDANAVAQYQYYQTIDAATATENTADDAAVLVDATVVQANVAWTAVNQATASDNLAVALAAATQTQTIADDAAQATLQKAINDATAAQTVSIAQALDVKTKAIDAATLAATVVWAGTLNTPWSADQLALAQFQAPHDDAYADALSTQSIAIAQATDTDVDADAVATRIQDDADAGAQDTLVIGQQTAIANFLTDGTLYTATGSPGFGIAGGQVGLNQQFQLAEDTAFQAESDAKATALQQYNDANALATDTQLIAIDAATEAENAAQYLPNYDPTTVSAQFETATAAAYLTSLTTQNNNQLTENTAYTAASQTYSLAAHAAEATELDSEAVLAKTAQIAEGTAGANYELAKTTDADAEQLTATAADLTFDDAQSTADTTQSNSDDTADGTLAIADAQPQATFDSATMTAYIASLTSWSQSQNTPWATYVVDYVTDQATLLSALDTDAVTDITADATADDKTATSDEQIDNSNDNSFMLAQDALGLTLAQGVLGVMGADLTRANSLDTAQIAQATGLAGAQYTDEIAVVGANQTLQNTLAQQWKILLDTDNGAQTTYLNAFDTNQSNNAAAQVTLTNSNAGAQQTYAQNLANARFTWTGSTTAAQVNLVGGQGSANVGYMGTQGTADIAFAGTESTATKTYDNGVASALQADDQADNTADDADVHTDDTNDDAQAHSDDAAIATSEVSSQNDLDTYLTQSANQYATTVAAWAAAGPWSTTQAANQATFLSAVATAAATWQQAVNPTLLSDATTDAGADQTEANHDADAIKTLLNSTADAVQQLANGSDSDALSAIQKIDTATAVDALANATASAGDNVAVAQAAATENTGVAQAQAADQVSMSGADDTYAYSVAAANTVYYESPGATSDYNTWQAAITTAAGARTSSDAGFNVTRVTALGTAQVNDATALAAANTNLVSGQQSANVTLAQLIQQASDAQADAGVGETAIQAIDGAGQTQANSFASDGSTWATATENADDGADETISSAVSTLTVAIGQAAANYNLAQVSAAATAAATTESATPSSANLFASQYASAAYQWTQLVAPQFVAMIQSSANADQQDEISDDTADETLAGQVASDESTFETTTAANDATDATADGEAAVEAARETAHNDDAYPVATAQADAALANTTATAQGAYGIANAQADATEQLSMATAGVSTPTSAMQTAYNTSVADAALTLAITQATADVTWTLAYSQAGISDAEGDVAADAKAAGATAAADSQDLTSDADAAEAADNSDGGHELTDEQAMIADASSEAGARPPPRKPCGRRPQPTRSRSWARLTARSAARSRSTWSPRPGPSSRLSPRSSASSIPTRKPSSLPRPTPQVPTSKRP